ncbi:DNA-binding protein [Candidatus Palauibacter sp.]|uniref:DNA-binding protein n=1 Tax=Candidatus Palauibacter sp. TaxID=3101350 RepID=UPI003B018A3A
MTPKTLFLAWQEKDRRQWFPVGRLDADVSQPEYRFRYTGGARRARAEAGFPLLVEFPELDEDYRSTRLFPLFRNRVINPGRPDLKDYLRHLDLGHEADPIEILAANGGHRATDAYEVFPKIEGDADGSFSCRFFLHGWRHVNSEAQERLERLTPGEGLYVTLELTNPITGFALQVQTVDYYMIGWAPRYLAIDLAMAVAGEPDRYSARVVRINPQPAPSTQRVLIEMRGRWDGYEPMNGSDYLPVVG